MLTKIANGETICSLGYREPSCGSDVFAATTRATQAGDGGRIDGQKMFTSGTNVVSHVRMLTRTTPDMPKHKGLTMFVVPLDSPGITVQLIYIFQDERTNITYDAGVKVKDSDRLGEVDGSVKVMAGALELEHDGRFEKTQRAMLRAAEQLCRGISSHARPSPRAGIIDGGTSEIHRSMIAERNRGLPRTRA